MITNKTSAVCENRNKGNVILSSNSTAKGSNSKGSIDLRNFTVIPVPGDGACLYTALSHGLFGSDNGSRAVRECIARQVYKSWHKYCDFAPGMNRLRFYYNHRRPFEYGGSVQLQAAADLFQVEINVVTPQFTHCFRSTKGGPVNATLHLKFSGNPDSGHYDFLAPTGWSAPTWGCQFRQTARRPRGDAGVSPRVVSPRVASPRAAFGGAATAAQVSEPEWTQVAPRRRRKSTDIRSQISALFSQIQTVLDHVQEDERENDADAEDCEADPKSEPRFEILKITGNYENLFKIQIRVDGLILTAAIDTGATRTIIHSRFVTNRSAMRKCNIKLQVANMTPMEVDGMYSAEIVIGDKVKCTHDLIVASTIDVDILIGNDINTKHKLGAILNFRDDIASFRSGENEAVVSRVEVPLGPNTPQPDALNVTKSFVNVSRKSGCSDGVYSVKPLWVPAGQVTMVKGFCRNASALPAIFESRKLLVSIGLESLECFLTDKLEIPVLNSLPEDLYIPRNTLLGRIKAEFRGIPQERIMKLSFTEALDQVEKGFLVIENFDSQTARPAVEPVGAAGCSSPPSLSPPPSQAVCTACLQPSAVSLSPPLPSAPRAARGPTPSTLPSVALPSPPPPSPVLPRGAPAAPRGSQGRLHSDAAAQSAVHDRCNGVKSKPKLPSLDNADITPEQKVQAQKLLEEFEDIFGYELKPDSFVPDVEINLERTTDGDFFLKNYPFNHHQNKLASIEIESLLKAGVIVEELGKCVSPIFVILKRESTPEKPVGRLIWDGRRLNKTLVDLKYPAATLAEGFQYCSKGKIACVLDLCKFFHTIRVSPESSKLLGITFQNKGYSYKRLPFGIKIAPRVAAMCLQRVLTGCNSYQYMDDIVTASDTFEQLLFQLRQIFVKLRANNLLVRPDKCELFQKVVNFLGMKVKVGDCVTPQSGRFRPLQALKNPKTPKQLKSTVCFLSYFRRFLKDFRIRTRRWFDMSNEIIPFNFTEKDSQEVSEMYDYLLKRASLKLFNPDEKCKIHIDASKEGIGGALFSKKGKYFVPCGFYSSVLKKSQKAYSAYHLEALALYSTVKYFEKELSMVDKFTIRTDCSSLRHIMSTTNPRPPIDRYISYLSSFQFDWELVKTDENKVADAMSRLPVHSKTPEQEIPKELETKLSDFSHNQTDPMDYVALVKPLNLNPNKNKTEIMTEVKFLEDKCNILLDGVQILMKVRGDLLDRIGVKGAEKVLSGSLDCNPPTVGAETNRSPTSTPTHTDSGVRSSPHEPITSQEKLTTKQTEKDKLREKSQSNDTETQQADSIKPESLIGEEISVGTFVVKYLSILSISRGSIVFQVEDEKGQRYALKEWTAVGPAAYNDAYNEITHLIEVSKFGDYFSKIITFEIKPLKQDTWEICILLEAAKSTLSRVMQNQEDSFTENEVLKIFLNVVESVAMLHSHDPPIMHRDIKVGNILLNRQNRYILSDFGSASQQAIDSEHLSHLVKSLKTTEDYRAPEMDKIVGCPKINDKADIWALGYLLFNLCFFKGDDSYTVDFIQTHRELLEIPSVPKYSPGLIQLLKQLLTVNQDKRPNIFKVLEMTDQLINSLPKESVLVVTRAQARRCPPAPPQAGPAASRAESPRAVGIAASEVAPQENITSKPTPSETQICNEQDIEILEDRNNDVPNKSKLIEYQQKDPKLAKILNLPGIQNTPQQVKSKQYRIENGILQVKLTNEWRTLLPQVLAPVILKEFHDNSLHSGIKVLYAMIARYYWWNGMLKDITLYVSSCELCGLYKPSNVKYGLLRPNYNYNLFSHLQVDYSFVYKKAAYVHCLVISDMLSNFVQLYPCKTTKTKEMIKHLKDFFSRFGVPSELHFDVHGAGKSFALNDFLSKLGVRIKYAASGAHFEIGKAEKNCGRLASGLKFIIGKDPQKKKIWYKYLNYLTFQMNNCPQAVTNMSAHEIVYGINLNVPIVNKTTIKNGVSWNSRMGMLNRVRKIAIERQRKAKTIYKNQYDKNRKDVDFQKNEPVFVWFERKASMDFPAKLQQRYRIGTIDKKVSPVLYSIKFTKKAGKSWKRLTHVSHMKKLRQRPNHLIGDHDLLKLFLGYDTTIDSLSPNSSSPRPI